jgi:hypothetical protein
VPLRFSIRSASSKFTGSQLRAKGRHIRAWASWAVSECFPGWPSESAAESAAPAAATSCSGSLTLITLAASVRVRTWCGTPDGLGSGSTSVRTGPAQVSLIMLCSFRDSSSSPGAYLVRRWASSRSPAWAARVESVVHPYIRAVADSNPRRLRVRIGSLADHSSTRLRRHIQRATALPERSVDVSTSALSECRSVERQGFGPDSPEAVGVGIECAVRLYAAQV